MGLNLKNLLLNASFLSTADEPVASTAMASDVTSRGPLISPYHIMVPSPRVTAIWLMGGSLPNDTH